MSAAACDNSAQGSSREIAGGGWGTSARGKVGSPGMSETTGKGTVDGRTEGGGEDGSPGAEEGGEGMADTGEDRSARRVDRRTSAA